MADDAHGGDDRRAPGRAKKRIEAALYTLAQSGRVVDPQLERVNIAKVINQYMGGALIGPWDVDQLDEGTIELFMGLVRDLPNYQKARAKVEDIKAKWRREHPTYRKH